MYTRWTNENDISDGKYCVTTIYVNTQKKTVTTALQTAISIEADTAMIPVEKYSKLR